MDLIVLFSFSLGVGPSSNKKGKVEKQHDSSNILQCCISVTSDSIYMLFKSLVIRVDPIYYIFHGPCELIIEF